MLSDAERRTAEALEAGLLSDPAFRRAVDPVARCLGARAAPVALGVGISLPAEALAWAVAEAVRQRCPLRVVHAGRARGAGALDEAVLLVRRLAPGVEVTAHLEPGHVDRVLLQAGRTARLLVLGTRAPVRRPVLRRGPLPWRVASAARCPVAVVRPRSGDEVPEAGCGVVVGVGPGSAAALVFGLRCARERRTCLTAVHAWTADRPADLEGVAGPVATSEAGAHRRAEALVDRWRGLFPDVPVVLDVVRGEPSAALVEGSAGAALVVVGTRGRGPARGVVLGSVSRDVVERGTAPVAVVPAAPLPSPTRRPARR